MEAQAPGRPSHLHTPGHGQEPARHTLCKAQSWRLALRLAVGPTEEVTEGAAEEGEAVPVAVLVVAAVVT